MCLVSVLAKSQTLYPKFVYYHVLLYSIVVYVRIMSYKVILNFFMYSILSFILVCISVVLFLSINENEEIGKIHNYFGSI